MIRLPERFHLSVETNSRLFGLASLLLVIGLKISRHFLIQSDVKPKPIVTSSRKFSRDSCPLQSFASRFGWTDGLFCVLCDWPQ